MVAGFVILRACSNEYIESSSSTYTEDYDISSLPGPILQKEAIAQQKQGAIIIEEVSTSEAENTEAFKAQLRCAVQRDTNRV